MPSDPADQRLSSYVFDLPEAFIAQRPVEPRHGARLLAVDPAEPAGCRHLTVWDLQHQLRAGDLLVVNNTRVLKARLQVRRASGGQVELLVLEPVAGSDWLCLARPAKRLKPGELLQLEHPGQPAVALEVIAVDAASGGRVVRFPQPCTTPEAIEALLARYGTMPLPPYIQQHSDDDDSRYQTLYASRPGAVAAPTAGLHLSDALLEAIRARGVAIAETTLHVGLGTFRPVDTEDLTQLELHSEWVEVSPALVEAVRACRARGGRVIAVGTTSVRSLEAVAQLHGGVLQPHTGPVTGGNHRAGLTLPIRDKLSASSRCFAASCASGARCCNAQPPQTPKCAHFGTTRSGAGSRISNNFASSYARCLRTRA